MNPDYLFKDCHQKNDFYTKYPFTPYTKKPPCSSTKSTWGLFKLWPSPVLFVRPGTSKKS